MYIKKKLIEVYVEGNIILYLYALLLMLCIWKMRGRLLNIS